MTAVTFPSSPNTNDVFTASNGSAYLWDGSRWINTGTLDQAVKRDGTEVSLSHSGDDLNIDGDTFFVDASTNRISVGHTTPLTALDISGDITVSGTVDSRDIATDGTKLDGIESSADVTDATNVVAALTAGSNITIAADGTISSTSVSPTAAEILTAISSVDGASSGLDADLLDGQHGAYYLDYTNLTNVPGGGGTIDADTLEGYTWTSSGKNLRGTEVYADNWFRNYNAGEGLYNEATGCHFVSDASDEWTVRDSGNSIRIEFQTNGTTLRGSLYADNENSIGFLNNNNEWGLRYLSSNGNSPNLYFRESGNESWTGNTGSDIGKIEYHSNRFYVVSGSNSTYVCQFRRSGSDVARVENDGKIYAQGSNLVWHAGNDGSGSGLDADTVDGVQGAYILRSDVTNSLNITNKGYFTTGTSGQNQNSGTISYGWGYQAPGAWSHPYPDLVFGYHTGMRFGGHVNYGGCRFYSDHPSRTSTILLSIGNGNSNVHVANNLTAGANITAYSSDRRLKQNFKNIESPLEKISKLNGCTFDWIENIEELGFTPDFAQNDIGLIAQEVEAVYPQAVAPAPFDHHVDISAEDPKDRIYKSISGQNFLTVKYEKLVPLLVEAIKELKAEIDILKNQKVI